MRQGVRIGLDLGAARIGVSRCDRDGILASPHAVWPAEELSELAARLRLLTQEFEVLEVVIGIPVDLRGEEGVAASAIRQHVAQLHELLPELALRLVDERLTTSAARKRLQEAGYNSRADKQLIDAAAATVLLEDALEAERRQGQAPGEVVR